MCMVFFFNDTATTEIYTLSLHDALPISPARARARRDPARHRLAGVRPRPEAGRGGSAGRVHADAARRPPGDLDGDRKSTRLNSSHANISYAVFCLKKKTNYFLSTSSSRY